MAVDAHNLGEFASISDAWKLYPNGGGFGDYITVNGVRVDWNEYSRSWGEQTETGGTTRPDEVVPHSIDVQGTGTFRDGVKVGSYVKDTSGANIDQFGNAEFRSVQLDALMVKYGNSYVPLSDFIKTFKTELPPDWTEYTEIPLFDDVRLLVFDENSSEKFYTTIGALKAVIGSGGSSGGGTVNIEIIRSDEPDKIPTDNNVFSALKVLLEIQNRSISKVNKDTAQRLIQFIEGITIGDFETGLLGSGAAIKNVNGTTIAEVDQLLVRQRAEFFSVLIHEARSVGGQLIISAANLFCTKVEEFSDFYRCYFDSKNGEVANLFANTDFARSQIFTGARQKFYWRKVIAVGTDYIELSKTNAAINSDIPEVGDTIFQLGSTDVNRQGAMILSTVGIDAPSFIQYSGIDSFSLEGKELTKFTRLGNRVSGKTVFVSSGSNLDDWATGTSQDIQDAQGAANAAALAAQQAIDDAAANVGLINTEVGKLQAQIDGEVSNWFYPYSPTLANYPASDWTTNTIKDRHIGDTFTNTQQAPATDAGKSWRFVKNGSIYSWTQIADSDAVLALQKAAQAQSTADGKSTTYLIQPSSYKFGDMWVLAADQTVNEIAYKSGDILTATQDSTTYNQAHWVKKVRYTDDAAVNDLQIGGTNLISNLPENWESGYWHYQTGEATAGVNYIRTKGFYPVKQNQTYQAYPVLKETYVTIVQFNGTVALGILLQKVGGISFTTAANCTHIKIYVSRNPLSTITEDFAKEQKLKVEEGDKATGWTPSPEDVQASIDAAVVKATYWSVKASAPVIYKDAINAATSGTHTPVTVSGELRSGTTTTSGGFITVTPNGGAEAGTASASPVTIAPANGDGKTSYTVRLYDTAAKTTLLDTMTIPVVFKGASGVNAINVVLSNEADVLPASTDGTVSDYSGSGTIIRVFEGSTELDYDGIGTANGRFNVTASATGITAGTKSESGLTCVFANASNMTADNATITFTIIGKTSAGASFSLTKVQAFAKSRTGAKGDKGDAGVSVTLVDVEFAKNTSPTTAPTTGWTTTAPTLADGEQLWTRTKTTYSSGNPTYSTPANITPKKGDTGAVGQGVESVTEEYAISTSKTVQPTTGWGTTQPEWIQGQYIWSRVKVVYKNPTSTVYTGYAVSSEWEAVNNLEIGGRNLLKNTNRRIEHSNYRMESFYLGDVKPQTGERVTIAFKGELSLNKTFWQLFVNGTVDQASNITVSDKGADGVWRKTFTWNAGSSDNTYLNIYSAPGTQSGISWIEDVMLVFGNKIAYYSKAPEDVQEEINQAKQEALTASNNVQTNVDSLSLYVDGAFKNGIIDETEAKAIEKYLNTLSETKLTLDASYTQINNNSYLEGAAKTNLASAKTALNTAYTNLVNSINTAIADGKTTVGEKNDVDNKFGLFNTALVTYQTRLEEANKAIQDKLKGFSDNAQNTANSAKLTAEQAQLQAEGFMRARYIRAWSKGNSVNNSNDWNEIKVINKHGVNIAKGKWISANDVWSGGLRATDEDIYNTTYVVETTTPATHNYLELDLLQVHYDIDYIQIWHYWQDGRTYFGTKTEISTDGVNWTPVFDSAKSGTYKETAAGNIISFRPNEVLAKVLKGAAVTDTFNTTVNGGLISTVMILLRELNSIIETAGISGIQDDGYLPAYWSGGTYAEALAFGELMRAVDRGDNPIASATLNANMSSIVMLHNGHAKVGELIVKSNGQIIVLDKATGKIKFIINSQDIPTVADLMSGTTFGETKNNNPVLEISADTILSETISVTKNNSNITFTASSLSLSAVLDNSRCSITIQLFKDGVYYDDIRNITLSGDGAMSNSISNIAITFTGCPIGIYSIRLIFTQTGLVFNRQASLSASVLKWDFTQSGVRYFQLGLNGLMAYYSDNHFHYTETGGLDVRGATNMPGVLLSGEVASAGGFASYWGAKKHASSTATKTATGTYTVYHNVGHSEYSVQITPQANRSCYVASKTASSFVVYFYTIGSTPALSDCGFNFTVFGKNYI